MSTSLKRRGSLQDGEEPLKRSRKLVEVVPDGDVLLKVGEGADALEIRVSGMVISLASDVFSRMLSSSFTEARCKEIELREDDPEVILDFCNIVHHKIENLNHCDGSRLLKLAELADARFCVKTLRPWVVTRLGGILEAFKDKQHDLTATCKNRISHKNSLELHIEQGIGLAAVFKLDDLFWFATRHMLLLWSCSPCSRNPRIPSFAEPALRSGQISLREMLDKLRKQRLYDFLDDVFQCVGKNFDKGFIHPRLIPRRTCSVSRYGSFILCLARKSDGCGSESLTANRDLGGAIETRNNGIVHYGR
ncbi:hypothetical protein AYO22_00415 [Fonsecaea multimorphosa]|nr:hypothetical protein AYO22_00415 [Fonsecaea multimorphosa]